MSTRLPVRRADTTSGGTAQSQFDSRNDLVEAEVSLRNKYKVTPKSEERTKLNPKIQIFGVDSEISTLHNKNSDIKKLKEKGEEFK